MNARLSNVAIVGKNVVANSTIGTGKKAITSVVKFPIKAYFSDTASGVVHLNPRAPKRYLVLQVAGFDVVDVDLNMVATAFAKKTNW